MFKVGDEVVLKHITGSGYCIVTDVSENQVEVKWADFPLAWYPNDLIRYADDFDRIYHNEGYYSMVEAYNKSKENKNKML